MILINFFEQSFLAFHLFCDPFPIYLQHQLLRFSSLILTEHLIYQDLNIVDAPEPRPDQLPLGASRNTWPNIVNNKVFENSRYFTIAAAKLIICKSSGPLFSAQPSLHIFPIANNAFMILLEDLCWLESPRQLFKKASTNATATFQRYESLLECKYRKMHLAFGRVSTRCIKIYRGD